MRDRLFLLSFVACLALVAVSSGRVRAQGDAPAPDDLIFVSDDTARSSDGGCDAISVIDARSGKAVVRGGFSYSTGRLAITSDAGLALGVWSNNNPRITVLRRSELGWLDLRIFASWAQEDGAIAISPDDQVVLIGAMNSDVRSYGLEDIAKSNLGPLLGTLPGPDAATLLFSCTSDRAYAVGRDGRVWPIDVPSMTAAGPIIISQPVRRDLFYTPDPDRTAQRNTRGALSPDGRYLVTNTGTDKLNVIDFATSRNTLLFTPAISQTFGVAFNYRLPGTPLLAVHGYSIVAVYEFMGTSPLRLVASVFVPPQQILNASRGGAEGRPWQHWGLLAWTGRGDGIIAAIGGQREFRIFDFARSADPMLHRRVDFDSCLYTADPLNFGQQNDVVTLNRPRCAPSVTPTPTTHPTTGPSPTATPSATPSPTMTVGPSATPTSTPPPTCVPKPLYLPIAVRERCDPEHNRADVALVIDTSSSMAGRKLDDAKAAAAAFVGQMDLAPGRDQVAVMRYDREAEVVCQLSHARAVIEAAIRGLTPRNWTHIDAGLRTALGELQSPRHLERNMSVMILLTDGVQTGTPGEELRAATEVRNAGVRLYTVGLGADVDAATLREMAGDDSRYHFAPDSADLARIYAEIASDILCPAPAGGFWPGR
jgi:uncharacterized protein YegL